MIATFCVKALASKRSRDVHPTSGLVIDGASMLVEAAVLLVDPDVWTWGDIEPIKDEYGDVFSAPGWVATATAAHPLFERSGGACAPNFVWTRAQDELLDEATRRTSRWYPLEDRIATARQQFPNLLSIGGAIGAIVLASVVSYLFGRSAK